MRTISDILDKIRDPKYGDIFGVKSGDLMEWLPYEQAREFLKPEATAANWQELGFPRALTREAIIDQIKGYMPFAWDKANNCRGLSAARSIFHMQAWLWLLGADEAVKAIEHYDCYGKPQLRSICEALELDWCIWDNGTWQNSEDDESGCIPFEGPKIEIPT